MVAHRLAAAAAAVIATACWGLFSWISAVLLEAFDVPGPPSLVFFGVAFAVHVPLLAVSVVPGAAASLNLGMVPAALRSPGKVLAIAGVLLFPIGGMWLLVGAVAYAVAGHARGRSHWDVTPNEDRQCEMGEGGRTSPGG